MAYPFAELSPVKLLNYSQALIHALETKDLCHQLCSELYMHRHPNSQNNHSCEDEGIMILGSVDRAHEVLTVVLKLLEENYHLNMSQLSFCDCFALGAGPAMIASHFGLKELHSIEMLSSSKIIQRCRSILSEQNIKIVHGRFQDYFIADADIVYFDCNLLGEFLDEGIFLKSFFQCCSLLSPGTMVILMVKFGEYDITKWGFEIIFENYSQNISYLYVCRKK